jgi:hypothetical protein
MAKKQRKLTTVAQVVEALGGTKAAAEWADVGQSAISNWIAKEFIPPGWHYRLDQHLSVEGYQLDPVVFGLKPHEARPHRRVA